MKFKIIDKQSALTSKQLRCQIENLKKKHESEIEAFNKVKRALEEEIKALRSLYNKTPAVIIKRRA